MNCKYYYGDHFFKSELELDDFLLDNGPELIDKYGDLAFLERDIELLSNIDICQRLSFESYNYKKNAFEKAVYNNTFLEEQINYKDGIAVTEFLEGLKVNERLMFPKFDPDNYFGERLKKWRDGGKFSQKELQDFKEEPEFANGEIPQVISDELAARLRKIEEDKWEHEAHVGTAIHKLCEIFFQRYDFKHDKGKEINFGIWGDKEDDEILRRFRSAGDIVTKYLSENHLIETLKYCRELRKTIESRFGENCVYYPELRIKGRATDPLTSDETNLVGTIDLLVIPPKGRPFIVDYKVSPADYWTEQKRDVPTELLAPDEYSSAKKRAFTYQLSTYARIMKLKNSVFEGMAICVAPAQLKNYRKENDTWKFDGIRTDVELLDNITEDQAYLMRVLENLDRIFTDIGISALEDKKILQILRDQLQKWFTKYDSKAVDWSLADIKELVDNGKTKIEENETAINDDMRYSYIVDGEKLYAASKAEMYKKILNKLNSFSRNIRQRTIAFKNAVKWKDINIKGYSNRLEHDTGDASFYENFLKRYIENAEYEVIEDGVPKAFESLGIVLLKNKLTHDIEVVKLTTQMVTRKIDPLNKNKLITLCFAADIVDKSSANFLLEAVNGNVELLETMLAINLIARVFKREGAKVHSIQVVNPFINSGLTASNKQLLYAYKTLLKYSNLTEDMGKNNIFYDGNLSGTLKFCTAAELALSTLRTGIDLIYKRKGDTAKNIKTLRNKCLTPLEDILINKTRAPEQLEKVLYDAIMDMLEIDESLKTRLLRPIDFATSPEEIQAQYLALLRAYAEVKGYDFKLLVLAYSEVWDNLNILLEGHSGLRTDNPGTTASDNLNKITEFIDDCYKRVTDSILRSHAESLEMVRKLKKSKHISYLGDSTFRNSIRIYDNMTKIQEDGDWVFVNPYDEANVSLSTEERNFLKYVINKINDNRFRKAGETAEEFEKRNILKLNEGAIEWIRVPLAYKGTQGKLEVQGLLAAAKDFFYSFKPREIRERLKLKFSHLFTPQGKQNKDDVYAMRTIFDYGENTEERMKMLLARRNEYDHDLLSVLLKHMFGYSLKNESEKAFVLLKAAYSDILFLECTLSRENKAEKRYLMDNVKIMTGNKLMTDKELIINEYASKIMKLASIFALGFSPKQIYQLLEGIYKDIGIVWRNEDGRYGFTLKEMMVSFADVYKEMGKFGFKPTKLERLNQLYRINDMDINVYALHLQNSHNLFRNFSSFLFRFASRPDFYNRMTIFESYMRHDGTFDAYELNDIGELEYHFEKDARFDALSRGDKSDIKKYKEQEALYLAMAKLFEREGAIYADGTEFKLETDENGLYKPLPQAYTNKQARSYKSMADKMYGYYSHEKKALMQSSLIGAMFWLMNTYWSGKKNQWFAISSVKDRGNFTHYSELVLDENGKPVIENGKEKREFYYYLVDEMGNVKLTEPPVKESELKNKDILVPFYLWEGNFSEGIAVTIFSMLNDAAALGLYSNRSGFIIEPKGSNYDLLFNESGEIDKSRIISEVYKHYWSNPNENLRTAYRQNIKLFVYDISILSVVGGILGSLIHLAINEYNNDHKDDHSVQQGMMRSCLALSEAIFDSATLDFDPTESIGGRGINWTPFSIEQLKRSVLTWGRVMSDDNVSFLDGMLNTFTFNRYTLKPFLKLVQNPELKKAEKVEVEE